MGLLKHFILPVLALVHVLAAFIMITNKEMIAKQVCGAEPPLSTLELHLIGAMGAMEVALFVNCMAGIFLENSHYRGMAVLLELIFLSGDLIDALRTGVPCGPLPVMVGLAAIGLAVHSNEPGIFTKDKAKEKAK
jgi:hypothetical protein